MIRVLHVVTHMNRGGLETMIMNYYRNIDRSKVQFDFLTHREYDGDYGEEIKQLGGIIYHLPLLNPFSITYRMELKKFFINHSEYKIIHVHQDCMSSIILKVAKECGVKVRIAHSHNISQDKNLKYPIKMFYRKLIPQYATHLMACGTEAGNWMFNGRKYKILNNAIDSRKYVYNLKVRESIRKEFRINRDELVIGHVGRFSTQKNHMYLVEIFERLSKKIPAKLILVGDGDLRKSIEDKVKALNLEDKVIFTGVRSDVENLLQAMDVFVFPSLYEGLPVTIVEAQAAGLPCVISANIPKECIITKGLVKRVKLSKSVEKWVMTILKMRKIKRQDTSEQIKANNFDILESAKWLEQFYLRKLLKIKER